MTREPDRFDKQARELLLPDASYLDVRAGVAAALRASHDAALDEAAHRLEEIARDYEGRKLRLVAMHEGVEAAFAAEMARAAWRCVKAVYEMKSPAAAPAAETCPEPPPGWETITTGPTAGCENIATYREPAAPAPALRGALIEAINALVQVWAAIGDRLLGEGPLSKEYAHGVTRTVDEALARLRTALASTDPAQRDGR